MKKIIMSTLCAATMLGSYGQEQAMQNPFFAPWGTPFEVPAFEKIKVEHYLPAYEEGMRQQIEQINTITSNPQPATFENTVLAMDNSGELLTRVRDVFDNLCESDITPEMEVVQSQVSSLFTAHKSNILLNDKLFKRIKHVYENSKGLDPLQQRLTEKTYKMFERSGANLKAKDKDKLRKMDEQLAILSVNFNRNLRNDNGAFALEITDSQKLSGLPQGVVAAAAEVAKSRGKASGTWIFTLDKASMIPMLQYADDADLRRQIYTGYLERCNHNDQNDNKAIIDSIVNLRTERAHLMGFPNHAAYTLDRIMAKEPSAVYSLIEELWTPALKRAQVEKEELAAIKLAQGKGSTIEPWDWWYYSEKLRAQKYNLNAEDLRPYFELNKVRDGIFDLTTKLYGITYKPLEGMPLFNPENQVFEVLDKDGSHLGVMYFDFHPRASKGVGAWCSSFREQHYDNHGKKVSPLVIIVCNFTKPTADQPALLNLDETETFFHEFGHGLHGLMQDSPYKGLSTVERDFVELPSQIMENWAFEPEVLKTYAKHYKTGEVIPDSLVQKIQASALFNQGFNTVEYLGASLLDMDFHRINEPIDNMDVAEFEKKSINRYGSMKEIWPRYRSTYFQHIFGGGYSSGYYAYIWAEVLDADAYEAFVQSGDIFNPQIADSFRKNILSKGGTQDGAVMYRNFRGAEPSKEPLMKKRGLI